MRALEGRFPVAPQRLQDGQTLRQPVHPHPGGVIVDPGLLVVGTEPPRSEPHLDTSLAPQAQRGDLLSEDNRIAKVVVQHERPHVEGLSRLRGHRQGDQRPELGIEMIGDVERRVAEPLGGAGTVPPVGHGRGDGRVHRESER